jgi:hypothetical protein
LMTGELATMVLFSAFGYALWHLWMRPLVWLLDDRILPAPMLMAAMKEDPSHLDMPKVGAARYIRLGRYSGVCPVCAGSIELRYGASPAHRRLFGCYSEAPQEHVFSFDRVTRKGNRVGQLSHLPISRVQFASEFNPVKNVS